MVMISVGQMARTMYCAVCIYLALERMMYGFSMHNISNVFKLYLNIVTVRKRKLLLAIVSTFAIIDKNLIQE